MSYVDPNSVGRLTRKFQQLPEEIRKGLQHEIAAAGAKVLADAKARVPVDTGALKDSITLTSDGALGWTIAADAKARRGRYRFNYAWFVEYGTSRKLQVTLRLGKRGRVRQRRTMLLGGTAQPFLTPAFKANLRPVLRAIYQAIRDATAKVGSGQ